MIVRKFVAVLVGILVFCSVKYYFNEEYLARHFNKPKSECGLVFRDFRSYVMDKAKKDNLFWLKIRWILKITMTGGVCVDSGVVYYLPLPKEFRVVSFENE